MKRVIWSFGKHQRIQQHLLRQRPIHTACWSFQNAEVGPEITIERSDLGPQGTYQQLLDNGMLRVDNEQTRVVTRLQILYDEVKNYDKPSSASSLFGRLLSSFPGTGGSVVNSPRGVYLYGSVGCGKTMLMDMLYKNIDIGTKKKRVHFNQFMIDVHKRIHQFKLDSPPVNHRDKTSKPLDPIPPIARDISDETWFLCFDEFQVTDVADAMILRRLFTCLFENGVVVIATSNRHPKDLYKNGLQRSNFLPFIPVLEKYCEVVPLSGIDYRRLDFSDISKTYFISNDPQSQTKLEDLFNLFCENENEPVHPKTLTVFGRKLIIDRACGKVAFATFDQLCKTALGAADYITLAQSFDTIILQDVPVMSPRRKVELRRFITLIDNFYDNKVRLILSAREPLDKLFVTNEAMNDHDAEAKRMLMDDLGLNGTQTDDQDISLFTAAEEIFAIERTVSRLTEMQSEQYWEGSKQNVE